MANPTPAITFRVKLTPFTSELHGPAANETAVHLQAMDSNAENLVSTWMPSLNHLPNYVKKHGDEFTLYGQKAVYVRNMYGIGYAAADRAILEIVSVE